MQGLLDHRMSILIGVFIGLVLGLTGAGGSVFAVPLLILLLDLSVNEAIGIAIGAVAVSAIPIASLAGENYSVGSGAGPRSGWYINCAAWQVPW